jgi:hypothetical protein
MRGYFGGVVPTLSFPKSAGALLVLGGSRFGCVVVTPLESVVTDPPFGGS